MLHSRMQIILIILDNVVHYLHTVMYGLIDAHSSFVLGNVKNFVLLFFLLSYFNYEGLCEVVLLPVNVYSLWFPVFVPHMAGTGLPPATIN